MTCRQSMHHDAWPSCTARLISTHAGMVTSQTVRCMQAKAYQQDAVVSILVQSGDNGSESAYGDGALIRLLTFQVLFMQPGCFSR